MMLDITQITAFAHYFVILSAGTGRQIRALQDDMVKRLKDSGVALRHVEGVPESGWVLLDFGDVIVHIFGAEERDFYKLDQLWDRAPQVVRIV